MMQVTPDRRYSSKNASIYLAVFHSRPAERGSPLSSMNGEEWPYDRGDDPSFYARRLSDGALPVTWAVCRGGLRNSIQEGDIVIFFSKRDKGGIDEYSLCAVVTVEDKLRQTDVARGRGKSSGYYNLLVSWSRERSRWEHFEPAYSSPRHPDWVWRIAGRGLGRRYGLAKKDFKPIQNRGWFDEHTRIKNGAQEVPLIDLVARNYIVFSNDNTKSYVLKNPIPVAARTRSQSILSPEKWYRNSVCREIRLRTLDYLKRRGGSRKSLRIPVRMNPHPHARKVVLPGEAMKWRTELFHFLIRHGYKNAITTSGVKSRTSVKNMAISITTTEKED